MTKQDRTAVNQQMRSLAAQNKEFATVHRFFSDLGETDGAKFIALCRSRMPYVAAALNSATNGALDDSTIIKSMRDVHTLNDEQVVKLSAVTLELVTRTVRKVMEKMET